MKKIISSIILVMTVILVLSGCVQQQQTQQQNQTNANVQTFDINTFISQNPGYADCSKPVFCNDLVYIDCHSEVDGPSYYLNKLTGERISECGGACMKPSGNQLTVCQTLCPPKEWTCE